MGRDPSHRRGHALCEGPHGSGQAVEAWQGGEGIPGEGRPDQHYI